MALDWRLRMLLLMEKTVDESRLTVAQAREDNLTTFRRMHRFVSGPGPEVHQVRELSIPIGTALLSARMYRPTGDAKLPVIVYFHGGGWMSGSAASYEPFCRALALASGCALVAVDYRLAPEHPAPTALNDCIAATKWVHEEASSLEVDGQRIALVGDSAGGNLATATAMTLRDEKVTYLRHLGLINPALDCDFDTASYGSNVFGYGLSRLRMQFYWRHYVPDEAKRGDWRFSPLRGDVAGLPRVSLTTAQFDVLHSEGIAFADKLEAGGVDVDLDDVPGVIHGFMMMQRLLPQARESLERLAVSIKRSVEPTVRRGEVAP